MNTYLVKHSEQVETELPTYRDALYWIVDKFGLNEQQRKQVKRTGKLESANIIIQRVKHQPTIN